MDTGKCVFCDKEKDLEHLFYSRNVVQSFCQDFQGWLQLKGIQVLLTIKEILFEINSNIYKIDNGINNLLVMCKQYIHKLNPQ